MCVFLVCHPSSPLEMVKSFNFQLCVWFFSRKLDLFDILRAKSTFQNNRKK